MSGLTAGLQKWIYRYYWIRNLKTTQQYVLAAQKANHILSCITVNVTRRSREMILSPYSACMIPHLQHSIQLYGPQHKKVLDVLKWVQRSSTQIVRGLNPPSFKDRLRDLGLFSMEKG